MDFCKLLFNILASILILMGLALASLGFYGPTLYEHDKKIIDDGTQKYHTQLKVAFFGIAMAGTGLVGLAALGIFSVNWGFRLLLMIFCLTLIIIAVLLLILAGLAFAAVYLRTTAFKDFWRPKMKKYDPKIPLDTEFFSVHGLQSRLPCCGLSGEDVYEGHETLPFSCCAENPIPEDLNPTKLDPKKLLELTKQVLLNKCTRAIVTILDRKGCDVAKSETFVLLGKIIAYGSCFVALYLLGTVFVACCVKHRGS